MNDRSVASPLAFGRIASLVESARERLASDVHIEPGEGAAFRIFTRIERIPAFSCQATDIESFLDATVDRTFRARLDRLGMADAVFADDRVGAIRIHASRGKRGPRLAIRLLARAIPELSSLGFPDIVETFTTIRSGLVLICGPAGSGKSTLAAAMLDRINATSRRHLILLEDPIEYTFRWLGSIVTQYEVGRDVPSFADGIRGALRADPDVIFIGELRGVESVRACLQAAETGHAVYAAIHTPSESAQAINRMLGLFPADEQDNARVRLADALRGTLGLRLVPRRDGAGLRAATEVLCVNDAVRRLIRDGSTHQLRALVSSSRREGMRTLESDLSELVAAGEIDLSEARAASLYPADVTDDSPVIGRRRSS